MAKVNICNVEILNNPASFFDPLKFRLTFECHEPLEEDLEWKLVYVSSAYNASLDQTLDSILVGPVPVGRHQFLFEADPPDPKKIPKEDVVGVTVVLIQSFYREKEFIRVGYYVNNEYKKEEMRLEPPAEPVLEELERHIIASDPRVTRFPIDWGDGLLDGCPEPEQPAEGDDVEQDSPNEVLESAAGEDEDQEEDDEEEEEEEEEEGNNGNEDDEISLVDDEVMTENQEPKENNDLGVKFDTNVPVKTLDFVPQSNTIEMVEPLHQVQSTMIALDGT